MTTDKFREEVKILLDKYCTEATPDDEVDLNILRNEYEKLLKKLNNRWVAGYLEGSYDKIECEGDLTEELQGFDYYDTSFWENK